MRRSGSLGLFLDAARSFSFRSLGGQAIFLCPALFILSRGKTLRILTAARFFKRVHAGFFRFTQQLGLKLLARHQALRRRGTCGSSRLRRARLRLLRRRSGRSRSRSRRRVSLRRGRAGFARLAQDTAPLHLNHDRILAAMAELLLHLAGFNGPLDAQRLAAQNRLVFLAVTHTTE